jgi:hypothetical protein
MAIGTLKSENVTNITAAPRSYLDGKLGTPVTVIDQVVVPTTATDDVGDINLFGPVPSNAVITELAFLNDALASSNLAFNVGLYYSGIGNGAKAYGEVADADCIATGKVITSANLTWQSVRFEAADITSVKQEAWQLAGLSADPGGLFYVGFTVSVVAGTPVQGDLVVKIDYIV